MYVVDDDIWIVYDWVGIVVGEFGVCGCLFIPTPREIFL